MFLLRVDKIEASYILSFKKKAPNSLGLWGQNPSKTWTLLSYRSVFVKLNQTSCQEQIELSGFLANELSAFLFLDGSSLGTGDERRTIASLTIVEELSIANLPRLLRSQGGRWLWVTPSSCY